MHHCRIAAPEVGMHAGQCQLLVTGMYPIEAEIMPVLIGSSQVHHLPGAAGGQMQIDTGVATATHAEIGAQGIGNGGDGIEQADKVDADMGWPVESGSQGGQVMAQLGSKYATPGLEYFVGKVPGSGSTPAEAEDI